VDVPHDPGKYQSNWIEQRKQMVYEGRGGNQPNLGTNHSDLYNRLPSHVNLSWKLKDKYCSTATGKRNKRTQATPAD